AVVFDLNIGSSSMRPDSLSGYSACEVAADGQVEEGNVGAGTGATVGKWRGFESWMKGGVGTVSAKVGDLIVGAIAVVNAVGDIIDARGSVLAGSRGADGRFYGETEGYRPLARGKVLEESNTTLVLVATNARLSKLELFRVSQRMHDGMSRAIVPVHTSYDGDVTFALSCGEVPVDLDFVSEVAAQLTAEAIRRGVKAARTVTAVPGLAG
ncbi:MAG TPA: peptidase S58, partial [Bacteroidetes bacterium]|nr:peptidase S58 [Bacteroidota bacterium]